jgi:hypothetical protein
MPYNFVKQSYLAEGKALSYKGKREGESHETERNNRTHNHFTYIGNIEATALRRKENKGNLKVD